MNGKQILVTALIAVVAVKVADLIGLNKQIDSLLGSK